MADDIKIKVGVQSSVKQDMDNAVASIWEAKRKIESASSSFTLGDLLQRGKAGAAQAQQEEIIKGIRQSSEGTKRQFQKDTEEYARMFGLGGNKAGGKFATELKKTIEGGGIMESLRRMASGDVAGAFGSLGQKIAMIGASFKAQIGIFSSAAAGWAIGKVLDDTFKISQKIADLWAGPTKTSIDSATKATRELRQEIEATKKATDFENKIGEIVKRRDLIGADEQKQYNAEVEKMLSLQSKIDEDGINEEERLKRIEDYNEQINVVKEKSIALDKVDADKQKEIADAKRQEAEQDEKLAKDVERRGQEAFAKELEMLEEAQNAKLEAEEKALKKQKEGIQEALKKEQQAVDARKEKLKELIDLGKDAEKKANLAMNPNEWRNAQDEEKANKRFEDRQKKAIENAKRMAEAGTQLPKRLQDLLDQAKKEEAGKNAQKEADVLDKAWKKKQIEGAEALLKIEKKLDDNLNMR